LIAVIDYGIGNVGSIVNMLKKLGVTASFVNTPEAISDVDKLILPGVGAFDTGMQKLRDSNLIDAIKKHASVDKKPLLGICLGMQMLGRSSEEGIDEGLNLIPFINKRFQFEDKNNNLKIPHMGWDLIETKLKNDPLLDGLEEIQRYYFVHSYHAVCDSDEYTLMTCDYGYRFTAAVKNGNIYGVQFHPEKSHKFGMALLDNFARRV
jgi:glutamine amidotransferase